MTSHGLPAFASQLPDTDTAVIKPSLAIHQYPRNDAAMGTSTERRQSPKSAAGIDAAVERSITRLGDVGYERRAALSKICETLTTVVSMLGSIGVGDTAALRRQLMAAEAKYAEENRKLSDSDGI